MYISYAQIGIGTVTPDNSSILDIESADKGVLFPRMTNGQKHNMVNPANGLMVYDTTDKCISINVGTSGAPKWECLNQTTNMDGEIPKVIVSNSSIELRNGSNYRQWTDVPDLEATFEILEESHLKIDWTLFTGQDDGSTNSGFAQMFTILNINGSNEPLSSNYLPMIHNPGGNNYRLLMNNSTFTYAKKLPAGIYTVKVRVYLASLLGSTDRVEIGTRINSWTGGGNMTNQEMYNATSNKLLITFL